MKILFWEGHCDWLSQLVLWDGENTYWCDEMKPSPRYKSLRQMNSRSKEINAKWTYIGEL